MIVDIMDNRESPEEVLSVLEAHLPYSLPVLRRLQFMNFPGGQTPDSHVLSTFDKELPAQDFAVAYLDFSRGPETEMWLYSSIENPSTDGNNTVCEEQILGLLKRVRYIESQIAQDRREWPGVVLIGTLHEKILGILEGHLMVKEKTYEHFKFIFKVENLPTEAPLLDKELSYSTVKLSDIPLVLSRTHIPRKEYWISCRCCKEVLTKFQENIETLSKCYNHNTCRNSNRLGIPRCFQLMLL
jgi:hypothetical protein